MPNKLKFPENFYWGSATSAHQVEGGTYNEWSEWEKKNAKKLAEDSEKRYMHGVTDKDFVKKAEKDPNNYISGKTADHYHKFREDFDMAKELGHNAHRFSIEWSRVEPKEGQFDEKEIAHYKNVIKALKERNLEPFVTLWHWTNPVWISNIGGWENKKTVDYFLRYVEKIVDALGDDVKFWIPLNEPQVYTGMSYITGIFPPNVKSLRKANKVFKNLIETHRKTYKFIHKRSGEEIRVGASYYMVCHTPYSDGFFNKLLVKILDYIRGHRFIGAMDRHQDFIGLQYYHHDIIKFGLGGRFLIADVVDENKDTTDMGWEIYPEGIYHVLKQLKKYNLPIFITENGLADAKDEKREEFIVKHLRWIHEAIQEGIDVRGYFYWSLLDNFEWDKGFWPRFGLIEINYDTLERKIRPSAWKYKKIIEDNAIEI